MHRILLREGFSYHKSLKASVNNPLVYITCFIIPGIDLHWYSSFQSLQVKQFQHNNQDVFLKSFLLAALNIFNYFYTKLLCLKSTMLPLVCVFTVLYPPFIHCIQALSLNNVYVSDEYTISNFYPVLCTIMTTFNGSSFIISGPWWHHDMEALSSSLARLVDSPHKGPVVTFHIFYIVSLSKLLNK